VSIMTDGKAVTKHIGNKKVTKMVPPTGKQMRMPLEGVRVLDLTIWQQGPVSTQMLADMGADVIKIEDRVGGDPGRGLVWKSDQSILNTYFECHNRNKRGITLDIRKEKGKEILYRLVKTSDVFVQNLRPGVAERLKIDYATLSHINPRLIYASGTGFGNKGTDRSKPSFDIIAQGRGGMLSVSGEPHEPPPLIQVNGAADWVGAVVLAYGVMVALFARERRGIGQEVEVSLLGCQASMGQLALQRYLFSQKAPRRMSRKVVRNPLWNTYQAGDDKWIIIAALQSQRFWPDFCGALGIEKLENDTRFNTIDNRGHNAEELILILDKVFSTKPRAEWIKRLEEVDIPCGPVNEYADVANDPQMMANEYIVDFTHPVVGPVKMVGIPVRLSATPGKVRMPAPEFGQHTEEVLMEVAACNWKEIAQLKSEEVV
jgi:crotonobetainyl-CoA:carnitine CoA-transferase CaiB-like acyl-CoA transferase